MSEHRAAPQEGETPLCRRCKLPYLDGRICSAANFTLLCVQEGETPRKRVPWGWMKPRSEPPSDPAVKAQEGETPGARPICPWCDQPVIPGTSGFTRSHWPSCPKPPAEAGERPEVEAARHPEFLSVLLSKEQTLRREAEQREATLREQLEHRTLAMRDVVQARDDWHRKWEAAEQRASALQERVTALPSSAPSPDRRLLLDAFTAGFQWAINGTDKHGEYNGGPVEIGFVYWERDSAKALLSSSPTPAAGQGDTTRERS